MTWLIVAVCALVTVATVVSFKWIGARHDRAFSEQEERLNRGGRSGGSRSPADEKSAAALFALRSDVSRSSSKWA
jgi:hypothetical protein